MIIYFKMLLLTIEQQFFISEGLRVFLSIFILLVLCMPVFYKVLLVMITDSIDCGISKFFFDDWVDPNTHLYQISDKMTDVITYLILLAYIIHIEYLDDKKNNFLILLLSYRLIGEILYFSTKERYFLLFFPNFFLETLLVLVGVKHFKVDEYYLPFFAICIFLWKLLQEYYLHVYKQNHLMES